MLDGKPANNISYIVGGLSHTMAILDNGTVVGVGGNSAGEHIPSNYFSSNGCSWQGTAGNMTSGNQICDRWATNPVQRSGF